MGAMFKLRIRAAARRGRFIGAAVIATTAGMLSASAAGGPVILAGHDADDDGFEAVYALLFDEVLADVDNGQSGILALGADVGSAAGLWIETVAGQMAIPQAVTFVNDTDIATVDFFSYAILHVPSNILDTPGGVDPAEITTLSARADDVADFVNTGGGLVSLTQGDFPGSWCFLDFIGEVTTVEVGVNGLCGGDTEPYDDITATPAGELLGLTDENLDGCCWAAAFASYPGDLDVLATATEPFCPEIDGLPAMVGGHVMISGQIFLEPPVDLNPPGGVHTVTATVVDGTPPHDPLVGVEVTMEVTQGPNIGETNADYTDINGEVMFSYVGDGGPGVDEIITWFVDPDTLETIYSNIVVKFWDEDCDANDIPDTCDIDCGGFGGLCLYYEGCGEDFDENGNGIPDGCELDLDLEEPDVFDADGEPNVEAVGDLDGNGTVDVVAVLPDPDPKVNGNIQVFLNDGGSGGNWVGLSAQTPIPVGRNPSAVAVGLFDGDIHLDLAVTNAGDDNVTILINNGTGDATFTNAGTVAVGDEPSAIVASSFNRSCVSGSDDYTDLAVTNEADGDVVILFGDGAGGFSPVNPCGGASAATRGIPVGQGPVVILADDFDNNDDSGDLSGGSRTATTAGTQTGSAWILMCRGDGTFDPIQEIAVGENPRDIAAGDFNGDGVSEIAVVSEGDGIADGTVSMLVNDGSGNFTPLPEIPVGPAARSVDAGDLDGDADPDLAVVADDEQLGGAVLVLQNIADDPGEVALGVPVAFGVGAGNDPNYVLTADINEDDALDIVTVNASDVPTGGSVSVLLGAVEAPPCPCDCEPIPDGTVDVGDFLALLSQWGTGGSCDCGVMPDGIVNIGDFLAMLASWGPCP
jgi:hypothetical protein